MNDQELIERQKARGRPLGDLVIERVEHDDAELARQLALYAEELERRSGRPAGLLRQAARRLVELAPSPEGGQRCPVCDAEISYGGRGRPRKYCSSECRRRA